MCFGCVPYRALVIEDDPKPEVKKPNRQWYMVRPGDGFYPVNVSSQLSVCSSFILVRQRIYIIRGKSALQPKSQLQPFSAPFSPSSPFSFTTPSLLLSTINNSLLVPSDTAWTSQVLVYHLQREPVVI